VRIRCQHGFFLIDEVAPGQVGRFCSLFKVVLVPYRGFFTFALLAEVPEYTVQGAPFLGTISTATLQGSPAELFEANGLVFDFSKGLVVPPVVVTARAQLLKSGNVYVSSRLVIPGSLTDGGTRVKDYTAWFSVDTMTFRYSEVTSD